MRRVDLHTHSTHSDGSATPTELVALARRAGLAALAVTDHDTTSSLEEARSAAAGSDLEIIDGCEISTDFDGRSVHVLAYGFRQDDARLQDLLERVRADRRERNRRMLAKLGELGCELAPAEVERHATGEIVARPHFARAMVERGYVPDTRRAYRDYLRDDGPAYVVVARPRPHDAVAVIREAGGVAAVAHPRQIGLEDDAWRPFLAELVDAGLAGLEIEHPSQSTEQRTYFGALAREFDLVWTGGSDYHGAMKKGVEVGRGDGTIAVPYETWRRLSARRQPPAGEDSSLRRA